VGLVILRFTDESLNILHTVQVVVCQMVCSQGRCVCQFHLSRYHHNTNFTVSRSVVKTAANENAAWTGSAPRKVAMLRVKYTRF